MEENLKEKLNEELPRPIIKPGGAGLTIIPVSSPAGQPTTPLPRVSMPVSQPFPQPLVLPGEKGDKTTLCLAVVIILNIISLLVLLSIGLDKIPSFLIRRL